MRYPRTQRAIVGVISEEMERAGIKPAEMNRLLRTNGQTMGRILQFEQDIPTAMFIELSKKVGRRAWVLMARIERRLKAG